MEYTTTINPMDDRIREELAKLATEPCREEKIEKRANYKELTGLTWNNLMDVWQVLTLICLSLLFALEEELEDRLDGDVL